MVMNAQLVNMYGIRDDPCLTYRPLRATDVNGGSVIGMPIPDLQVYVLDRYGQPSPIGVPGKCMSAALFGARLLKPA